MSRNAVKRIIEFIDGRKVEYISWRNKTEGNARDYCAKRTKNYDSSTGKEFTLFDVELPGGSVKNAVYAGEFANYRELDFYYAKLRADGEAHNMVARVATDKPGQYVLLLEKELDSKLMYYIFAK